MSEGRGSPFEADAVTLAVIQADTSALKSLVESEVRLWSMEPRRPPHLSFKSERVDD